jgi:hypothetical protein
MRDYQDKTDERLRPVPGDRTVAGMPVTGADQGRGPAAGRTEDSAREDDRIILSSRTEDEPRDGSASGRDETPASQTVEPGGPADPLGERTAGPGARPSAGSPGAAVLADGSGADAAADGSGMTESRLDTAADGSGIRGSGTDALAGHDAAKRLIGRDDADRFESRWREVKAGFVDDPRDSVERASALCEEAVTALTTALEERRGSLKEQWDGDADTEHLRTALRAYGVLLERLASV